MIIASKMRFKSKTSSNEVQEFSNFKTDVQKQINIDLGFNKRISEWGESVDGAFCSASTIGTNDISVDSKKWKSLSSAEQEIVKDIINKYFEKDLNS